MRLSFEDFLKLKAPYTESKYLVDVNSIEELNLTHSLAIKRGIVRKCSVLFPIDINKDKFTILRRDRFLRKR